MGTTSKKQLPKKNIGLRTLLRRTAKNDHCAVWHCISVMSRFRFRLGVGVLDLGILTWVLIGDAH